MELKEAIGQVCQRCLRVIKEEDYEPDRKGKTNGGMRINNIPGYFHKRCKAIVDMQITSSGKVTEVFNKNKILGGL